MAHGPKSKKRKAKLRRNANLVAQQADYRGAADAAEHASNMDRFTRRHHVLAYVYAACHKAGYNTER